MAQVLTESGMKTKVFQFQGQLYLGELVLEDENYYYFDNLKWFYLLPTGQVVVLKGMLGMSQGLVAVPKGQVMIADATLEAVKEFNGGASNPNNLPPIGGGGNRIVS